MYQIRAPQEAAVEFGHGRATSETWPGKLIRLVPAQHTLAVADQGVVSAGSFLCTVGIGRWAAPHELGEYAVGMTVLFFLVGTQEALITIPYTIRRHRAKLEPALLAGGALLQGLGLAAIAASGLLLVSLVAAVCGGDPDFALTTATLGLLAPFLFLKEFARQLSFSHGEVVQALAMDCLATMVQVSGIAWLGLTGSLTAEAAFLVSGVGFCIAAGGWLVVKRARFRLRPRQLRLEIVENLILGRWLVLAQVTVSIQGSAASWLLVLINGAHVAGIYAACAAIVAVANPIVTGCANILLPTTALTMQREGVVEMRRRLVQQAYAFGALLGGFLLVLAFGSDWAMHLLFRSGDYRGHEEIILLLGFALLITAIGIPASNGLASVEHPRAIFWAAFASAGTNAALGSMLIPFWGMRGAALGALVGSLVGMAGRWAALARLPGLRPVSWAAQTREILQQFDTDMTVGQWGIRRLGEGKQAIILAASRPGSDLHEQRDELVVKLYKPGLTQNAAAEQFGSLCRLHSLLDGLVLAGWRIAVPAPLWRCDAPPALVMTKAPGRSLWCHIKRRRQSHTVDVESVAQGIAMAMTIVWSAGETYGDLNLENILYDPGSRTLSFVDPGTLSVSPFEQWTSRSQDLAYFVFDSATSLRRTFANPRAGAPLRAVTVEVIRRVLAGVPQQTDQQLLLDEIHASARAMLGTLQSAWTPHGIWRALVRRIAFRRVESLIGGLRLEIAHSVG